MKNIEKDSIYFQGGDDDLHSDAEPVVFGDECDLHCFPPEYTREVILEFLKQAGDAGQRRVRLVHGKGGSQKKMQARKILSEHPAVESFSDDGCNWGATIIFLKGL